MRPELSELDNSVVNPPKLLSEQNSFFCVLPRQYCEAKKQKHFNFT